ARHSVRALEASTSRGGICTTALRYDSSGALGMSRLVKRYGNRKLYDTSESRDGNLDEIGRWVKAGEDVKILENDTGEDLTAVTFAQIILEEERQKNGPLSLRMLRDILQHRAVD